MNNQSPLVPQGSLLDQKNKGRTRVEIAVFVVLAIHGIGLLALLMQGCQKPPETLTPVDTNTTVTTSAPAFVAPTNTTAAPAPTNVVSTTPAPTTTVATATAPVETAIPAAAAAATEYTIAQGDTLSALAKNFHVKVKAIEDANPGIDPTKLKVGQKIHIPAPPAAAPTAAATSTGPADAASAGGEQVYTVKSGDTLGAIAKANGVHIKDLRAVNNLKTDRITVGQKLKLPAKSASAPAPDATTPATGGTPPSR